MTSFLIAGVLLVAAALLFVLPPLLRKREAGSVSHSVLNIAVYRDQLRELDADVRAGTLSAGQYENAKKELEARMLEDLNAADTAAKQPKRERITAIVLGLSLPLCAVALYLVVGNPQVLAPELAASDSAHEVTPQQIEEMVQRLAARLESNPDNAEGWVMLARSYSVLGRFEQAAAAYANAVKRLPEDAQLLVDYADALGMAQGRRLEGEPEKLVLRALRIEPNNIKALALAGSAAFERKDYAAAVDYWQKILGLLPPESEMARSVSGSIAEARSLGQGNAVQQTRSTDAAAGKNGVSGVVKLAPELAAKVAPTDIVFIFARAAEGPRMPLAILRKQARELPYTFRLDDTMAMAQGMSLSSFPQVVVGARISKSANATPRPGDLEGFSKPISNHATGVTVVISNEVR